MTVCGYTPREIDELTLPQVLELFEYWNEFPPPHELLMILARYKSPSKGGDEPTMSPEEFAARNPMQRH